MARACPNLQPASELVFCLLLALIVFAAVEIEKMLARRGLIYSEQRARPGLDTGSISAR
jgi:hypothetical protein